ncbi:MAG: DUF4252 domain-containing protein [Bacteroidota bacterium]
MKYLLVLFIALLGTSSSLLAQPDAISQYFDQYVDNEDFTVVYVSAKMFEILGKLDLEELKDEEAEKAMEVVKNLKGIRVLTTEKEPMKYYNEAVDKINTNDYELLVKVREEDENVHLFVKDEGDIINELFVLVGGVDEFVLVSLIGDIDLKTVSKLAKSVDMKGVEHLEKLNKKDGKGSKEY